MDDLKNILSGNDDQFSNDDLLKYLDNKMSEKQKHDIEKKLVDNIFESDAVDGLLQLKNPQDVQDHVSQLNKKLHQHLWNKKYRKQKRELKQFHQIIVAIIILLLICVIAFAIIHLST